MTQRLPPEREARIRTHLEGILKAHAFWGGEPDATVPVVRDLLQEIDALRAELAGAEERGYKRCQADVIDWLHHRVNGNERDEARDCKLAAWIERGDHVRTGATAADGGTAGESGNT